MANIPVHNSSSTTIASLVRVLWRSWEESNMMPLPHNNHCDLGGWVDPQIFTCFYNKLSMQFNSLKSNYALLIMGTSVSERIH